jgi:hypothetical protein
VGLYDEVHHGLMTDFDSAPTHVDARGLPVMDHLGYLCRVPVEGSATGGAFSLVEERGRLGCMSPRHLHDRESETFIVLDGAWRDGAKVRPNSSKPAVCST